MGEGMLRLHDRHRRARFRSGPRRSSRGTRSNNKKPRELPLKASDSPFGLPGRASVGPMRLVWVETTPSPSWLIPGMRSQKQGR
jgi:hypothetical protein